MTAYVALIRAVNVGGTGRLAMADLRCACAAAGFSEARTYLASGNVVFASNGSEPAVKAALQGALSRSMGRPAAVLVRTADQLRGVLTGNPFPDAAPSRTVAIFLDVPPPPDALYTMRGRGEEHFGLGTREIYVAYGAPMGRSKLVIPAAAHGTARNMTTVAALAAMARA